MKRILTLLTITSIAIALTGCQTAVKDPSSVTLVNAMKDLGAGFAGMKAAENGTRTGLIPDTADVTFNITADSKDNKSLSVDLKASTPPTIPVNASADVVAALTHAYNSARGNTVTIHFVNIMTMDNSKSMAKSLDDIEKAFKLINDTNNPVGANISNKPENK